LHHHTTAEQKDKQGKTVLEGGHDGDVECPAHLVAQGETGARRVELVVSAVRCDAVLSLDHRSAKPLSEEGKKKHSQDVAAKEGASELLWPYQ
jgi:hypothetical protein